MTNQLVNQTNSVQGLLKNPAIQKKFNDVLKDKSNSFTSSLISLVNGDGNLSDSEPMSIVASAMQAAQLDLPIEKQLGLAYIVPFNGKDRATGKWVKKAQFMLGYKGYIQLAQRSGQYRKLTVDVLYEGELIYWDRFKEDLKYDMNAKTSDEVVGYFGHFELLNGFEKTVYWTKEQVEKHRIENNKAKDKRKLTGVWASNYDAMAQKTVIRNLLSKWGILSIEMQNALVNDDTVNDIDNSGQIQRADVTDSVDDVQMNIEQNANKETLDFGEESETEPAPEPTPANNIQPKTENINTNFETVLPGF
ncbi:recombinase RecT [Aerococcus viridans]|uniref:recombinase RecT n=1 Tax=Aerococcus viridans TaxID=1377 RepID=UPI002DBC61BF|nr:recombinase RecT [Aerococcus viridans]MEB7388723.1 recombinase RecT [Aerococcus viridans]